MRQPSLSYCLAAVTSLTAIAAAGEGGGARGPAVYQKHCVECHGAEGQGNEAEEVDALYGDRSVGALARLIERTMPEEDPGLCVGEDAQAVARYIYDAFYSPAARERLGQLDLARIELSRLTVPQYRNAVADLLGHFGGGGAPAELEAGGLRGYYFNSKGMNKKEGEGVERLDPVLDFDFGEGGPVEGVGAEQFSIVWEGSFYARDTGHYEFRTRTPNGARLYVNTTLRKGERNYRDDSSGAKTALIDDWVSSGTEVRTSGAKVFLLGGRRYPVRLDYFKYKEKIGKVGLDWKTPHGSWRAMGGDVLSPTIVPRTFVVSTPFPADDRSHGYERGTSVSEGWHAATTAAAVETAEAVVDDIDRLAGAGDDDPGRVAKLRAFCARLAEAAFRRPLSEAERGRYVDAQFATAGDPERAVKRCVLLCLKSPRFLYPELPPPAGDAPDPYTVASRLSFALWDSAPDQALLAAAASGRLRDAVEVAGQARRMLGDPRARAKVLAFFEHWLEMDERDLGKDKSLFPGFDEAVVADLRESLLRFVEAVVWEGGSDYRELLRADYLLLNGRLAALYGGGVEGEGFRRAAPEGGGRAGVLTHPYLLSAFAYHNNTSPIHRGVFLTRNIVGRALKPPPVAVAFEDGEFDPGLTMREKVTRLTRDAACMSCHSVINPLGFSLENFDAVGRWRTTDNQKPVDPGGEYTTAAGETVSLSGARDIAGYAAASPAAHRAFVAALFHHLVKQPVAAYGPGALGDLREGFSSSSFNIRELTVAIATAHALHGSAPAPGRPSSTPSTSSSP